MNTRPFPFLAAAGALALLALAAPEPISGQNLPVAGVAADPLTDPRIDALVAEITAQHAEIARNQAQIEEKIARVSEAVRQARIYAARGGAKK